MRDELIGYTGVGALVRGDCRAVDVVFQGVAGPHGVAAGSAARSVVPPVNPVKVCLSERAVKDHRLLQQLQRPVVRRAHGRQTVAVLTSMSPTKLLWPKLGP